MERWQRLVREEPRSSQDRTSARELYMPFVRAAALRTSASMVPSKHVRVCSSMIYLVINLLLVILTNLYCSSKYVLTIELDYSSAHRRFFVIWVSPYLVFSWYIWKCFSKRLIESGREYHEEHCVTDVFCSADHSYIIFTTSMVSMKHCTICFII